MRGVDREIGASRSLFTKKMINFAIPKSLSSRPAVVITYLPFVWWWNRKRPRGYSKNRGHLSGGLFLFPKHLSNEPE